MLGSITYRPLSRITDFCPSLSTYLLAVAVKILPFLGPNEKWFMANLALNPVGLVDPVSEKLALSPVALDRRSCLDSLATFAEQRIGFGGTDLCLLLGWEESYLTESRHGQKGWCL